MNILIIICTILICVSIITYDKWSYKRFYERCEINSKHPDWTPNCYIDFFKEDPQWFIDNGYGKYVK